ncbi:MAG: hypothetical protein V4592_22730 [Bacteroidota bacterium]
MNHKKSAFLFPLHEPKFVFGSDLIASINKYLAGYPVFVVFSNTAEADTFGVLYPNLLYTPIAFPYGVDSGIINKKKFYGIQQIIETTGCEYIACIDSEACIIKSDNVDQRFEHYYNRKTLFATNTIQSDFIDQVIKSSYRFFDQAEAEQLHTILNASRLYYWFNEIPVYRRDVFIRFAQHIQLKQKFETLTWFDFDYLLYGYYCLLHEGFKIEVITDTHLPISFMESQGQISKELFSKGVNKIQPGWIKQPAPFYQNAFMTFHNDRDDRKFSPALFLKKVLSKVKRIFTR